MSDDRNRKLLNNGRTVGQTVEATSAVEIFWAVENTVLLFQVHGFTDATGFLYRLYSLTVLSW